MPQTYHHPPRIEEGSSPESSDIDDEIVLSDLVRTGEASRLRRRGAMRIDHTRDGGGLPLQPPGNRPSAQGVPAVESVPNTDAIWGQDQADVIDEEYSPDSYSGEWLEARDAQADDLDYPEDLEKSTRSFILYCGGEEPRIPSPVAPHLISPLPQDSRRTRPPRAPPTSNGCGVVIHTAAVPRKRCSVWMARSGSTDAIIEMDPQYFDRSIAVRMMKNPCGCVREGIGCRFCGNPLGTRYRPCKAAAKGLFTTVISPSHPNYPSGSAYWRNQPSPLLASASYIYTLFPDRVSSSPSLHLTSAPCPTNIQSVTRFVAEQLDVQPSTSNTTTTQSRLGLDFDADGNPIGESTNSPDKVIEPWSGR